MPLPKLTLSQSEADRIVREVIERGDALADCEINSEEELGTFELDVKQWQRFARDVLRKITDSDELADEFQRRRPENSNRNWQLPAWAEYHRRVIRRDIGSLNSVRERIPLMEAADVDGTTQDKPRGAGNKVFIVHGHDEAATSKVELLITKLGLQPVVLSDRPNKGQTIIEKLESESNVSFAVVILTPDDVGAEHGKAEHLRPRARQNVILELGYFIGRLGRESVCTLYYEGVELPSDVLGVVYVPLDSNEAWRFKLGSEMKESGLDVDLNRLHG